MQIDSHYHATYVMARAAGLRREIALTIATGAQFVDDNVAQVCVKLRDGGRVDAEATAHHPVDLENLSPQDQRQVWVPFHFLPGNQGDSFTERLKCRKDSPIARELIAHHLELADSAYAVSLMGIAAHVYADTFSHYGFSGVSSPGNKVINDSFEFGADLEPTIRKYITDKFASFKQRRRGGGLFESLTSWAGETASGALGHGSVATYPDRPYLEWSFEYETPDAVEGKRSVRDNRVNFVQGFAALHRMFREFAARRPDLSDGSARDFDDIEQAVRKIVCTQAPCEGREAAWQAAARAGHLYAGGELIPAYPGMSWNSRWEALDGAESCASVHNHAVWRFYQAAAVHRTFVLRDLLPRHGLIVA